MKNQDNKTPTRIVLRFAEPHAALSVLALATALLLAGCANGGGSANTTSTATWPSATPPAPTQTNTYIGTQSPGLYTITVDHTKNSFSFQNLSTSSAVVSGTFTTTANGFLNLGSAGYALEMPSRAVLLIPSAATAATSAEVFGIASPSCQVIPEKTAFGYVAMDSQYSGNLGGTEDGIGSGTIYASTDSGGANWAFGGELQYDLPYTDNLTSYTPLPDPFTATCAAGNGESSVIQTAITVPSSIPANFVVGPTGFFLEDRYQSSLTNGNNGVAFIGAVAPPTPVNLSALNGLTFLGVQATGGNNGVGLTSPRQSLVSFTASTDKSGNSILLTGGAFPSNDPTQVPGSGLAIDLGAQDANNNGSFQSASATFSTGTVFYSAGTYNGFALVSNAGGKYTIFVVSPTGTLVTGWILFQQ